MVIRNIPFLVVETRAKPKPNMIQHEEEEGQRGEEEVGTSLQPSRWTAALRASRSCWFFVVLQFQWRWICC